MIASFYASTSSKDHAPDKDAIQNHLVETIAMYEKRYKHLFVVVGGDKNKLDMSTIEDGGFDQLVDIPTRDSSTLDVIYSNLLPGSKAWSNDPLMGDSEEVSSDHRVVLIDLKLPVVKSSWETVWRREFHKDKMVEFEKDFTNIDWERKMCSLDLDARVELLNLTVQELTDQYFPMKKKKVRTDGELWFNDRLQNLKEKASRLYRIQKNSDAFKQAKKKFRSERAKAEKDYYSHVIKNLKGDPKGWHKTVKNLASNGGSKKNNKAPEVTAFEGHSDAYCAEKYADHIQSITSTYTPISADEYHAKYRGDSFDVLTREACQKLLLESKIPDGLDRTDPNKKLLRYNICMFLEPLFHIYSLALA